MIRTSCVYAVLFETAADHTSRGTYQLQDFPRPFVIEPPFSTTNRYQPGETLTCYLILAGRAIDYMPYFVLTFMELGKAGIGSTRGKYRVQKINNAIGNRTDLIYDGPSEKFLEAPLIISTRDLPSLPLESQTISIKFQTPTRIKAGNSLTNNVTFPLLIQNLLRRISLVNQVAGNSPWDIDFKGLIQKATDGVSCKSTALSWYEWKRYSSRQKTLMNLGGFLGKIVFEGDLREFFPLLQLGEYLHIGKASTFGLGKYEMKLL